MKKFWNWKTRTVTNQETQEQIQERTLFLNGTIAEESWFDDDVTPQLFKDELMSGSGDITVWINSPGGDCVAAQIYNMLMDYKGNVTVKIDGIAASAASVIAMAGTKVLMSPTALMMIHNPLTVAIGDSEEMQKAIDMLSEVKESILNAYEIKTKVKANLILEHTADDELLKSYITAAVSYAESYQHIPEDYYKENPMPPTTEQAVIMLSSHFYESRDGSTGGFFADNTGAAQQVWNTVNLLLRLDRRWQV